ncbi:hypothetical protein Gogos_010554, partial [Gossypium gossypioides]|nr:hypothetical protein [Gossypium gossypioides]
ARSQPKPPSPPEYVLGKVISKEVEALFLSIQGRMFIFEKGFDLSESHCKEFLDLVRFHLDISLRAISDYYGVPHYERDELFDMELEKFNYVCMDAILAYLTDYCGEFERRWRWIPPSNFISLPVVSSVESKAYKQDGNAYDPKNKSMRKRVEQRMDWQRKMCKEIRRTIHMLGDMKSFLDRLAVSEGIEGLQWPEDLNDSSMGGAGDEEKVMEEEKEKEEEDDEVMKDNALELFHDDFKEAFMPTHASTIGFIIQDPSYRLNYLNSM